MPSDKKSLDLRVPLAAVVRIAEYGLAAAGRGLWQREMGRNGLARDDFPDRILELCVP
jgi:hypothetical protein